MAAQRDPVLRKLLLPDVLEHEARPSAAILPLRQPGSHANRMMDETPGDRLGTARGLMVGLALGATLWIGLFVLAWVFFR